MRYDGFNQRFTFLRSNGSPPVIRTLLTPSEEATRIIRVISSYVRICARGFHVTELGFLFRWMFVSPLLTIKVGCFLSFGKAIGTTEIAAVSDADPQVPDDSFVVSEVPRTASWVTPSGGVLVEVGAILTVPSRRISTFKSALVVGSSSASCGSCS